MKLSQLINEIPLAEDVEVTGLSVDSRLIKPGYLFAGLPGSSVDGARFIDKAVASGAKAILTHEGFDGEVPPGVALIRVADPRLLLAGSAARFFSPQPSRCFAVTGTNGKTSVASFVRQIWEGLDIDGASLGTVGMVSRLGEVKLAHTTPEPITLHAHLQTLAIAGIEHVVVEASSHGLQQRRLDGLTFEAAGFTNITRDHLDYHKTFEAYFAEKQRLFTELMCSDGVVVVAGDAPGAEEIAALSGTHGLETLTVGKKGAFLKVLDIQQDGFCQLIELEHAGGRTSVRLPLVGDFQVANALVAAGMVAAGGVPLEAVLGQLEKLRGAIGRLEWVGARGGAPVFVDYAHTPDALARAIEALLPYKTGRMIVVFGCGGDRDRGKRPLMGAVAGELADLAIVTDDNPRSEEAGAIRREILTAVPDALDIADRASAIRAGIEALEPGDVLLVAGKGHETGQIVGNEILPFSDHTAIVEALAAYE